MNRKRYGEIVWERGVRDTRAYYAKDRRAWVYNIGSAVLGAILSPLIYRALGLTVSDHLGLFLGAGVLSAAVFLAFWLTGVFLYHLWAASASLYSEQKVKADLYTVAGIDVSVYAPTVNDIRPFGLMVTNQKPVPIRAAVFLVKVWKDRTELTYMKLPKTLDWWVDGELRSTYQEIQAGKTLLIGLEHIETTQEQTAIHITISEDGKVLVGESPETFKGLVFAAIYVDHPLRIEILCNFIIQGLYLKCRQQFIITYDGKQLSAKKVGDWILDSGQTPELEPTAK